jgi:hypothetical protein
MAVLRARTDVLLASIARPIYTLCAALMLISAPLSPAYAQTQEIVEYEYDAAGNIIGITRESQTLPPVIDIELTPNFVNIGRTRNLVATGENLLSTSVETIAPGVIIGNVVAESSRVTFSITATESAEVGPITITFTTLLGSVAKPFQVADPAPDVRTIPAPISLGPSSNLVVQFVFSESASGNEVYDASIDGLGVAVLPVGNFTVLDGASVSSLEIAPVGAGSTTLGINLRDGMRDYSFSLFVADPFVASDGDRIASDAVGVRVQAESGFDLLALSSPVGVKIGSLDDVTERSTFSMPVGVSQESESGGGALLNVFSAEAGVLIPSEPSASGSGAVARQVGVISGAALLPTTPISLPVTGTTILELEGVNLQDLQNILVAPSDDVVVEDDLDVAPDGSFATVTVTTNGAALGERLVLAEDGSGGMIGTSDGSPIVVSIE